MEGDDGPQIPDFISDYKPPKPPKWKKRERFDPDKFADIDAKAKQVIIDADTTFEELASQLTFGLSSDLQKVRSIFIWVGHQNIEGTNYKKVSNSNSPTGFMRMVKEGEGTYVQFFTLVCRAARLSCVIVRGVCKGGLYEVGDQDVSSYRASWNAVLIDGSWQIVHPLWAFVKLTGHETGKWTKIEEKGNETRERATISTGVKIRGLDNQYFLPHPEDFIYRCLADKKEWQLVKQPWDMRKFCNVPEFTMAYFTSDYKLKDPHQATVQSINGKCEIDLVEKGAVKSNLTYELFFDENESPESLPPKLSLPRSVFFETNGTKLRILIRFYVKGIYKLSLYTTDGLRIIQFRLEVKQRSTNTNMLPVSPAIGFGFGHTAKEKGIKDPSHRNGVVVAQSNQIETFYFTMIERTEILAKLQHIRIESHKLNRYLSKSIQGNNVSIKVTMPDDSKDEEYALQVFTEKERDENNVLNYLLTNRKKDFEDLTEKQNVRKRMQEEKIRRSLDAAVVLTRSMSTLEKAVKDFEEAQLKDINGNFRKAKTLLASLKEEHRESADIKHWEGRLKAAVKSRNLQDIDSTVKEAGESEHSEKLEETIEWARNSAIKIEQEEIRNARASAVREWMKKATEEKDMEELEQSMSEFQASHLPDKGDLKKAKSVLRQLNEEAVKEAMDDIKKLEDVLRSIQNSIIAKDLEDSSVVIRGQNYLQQQKRIKGHLSSPLEMNSSTVAEIQMYKDPRPVTQDIMRATMIVLGRDPRQVAKWSSIQRCLKPSGELLRTMNKSKKEMLHRNTVKRARELLDQYTIDDAWEVSAGVAAFYRWCHSMMDDESIGNSEDEES